MSTSTSHVWDTSMKWREMTVLQKGSQILKVIIAACTFGFVFPNVWD